MTMIIIIIFKIMIFCAPFISKSSESNNSKETAKAAASNHVRHMMLLVSHPGDDYGDDDDDNEGDGDGDCDGDAVDDPCGYVWFFNDSLILSNAGHLETQQKIA